MAVSSAKEKVIDVDQKKDRAQDLLPKVTKEGLYPAQGWASDTAQGCASDTVGVQFHDQF